MLITKFTPPKPRSEGIRNELTRLPRLTWWRKNFRYFLNLVARILLWIWTKTEVSGLENLTGKGPLIIVANHLGDADLVVGLAVSPVFIEIFAKSELYDIPLLGKLLDAYGVIWVHRGQPDRKAIRAALQALRIGRKIGVAPEGRESLTGSLEEGTGGAAYLALKSNVPLAPVTITCTENKRVFGNMKRFRRTAISVTIGPPFRLEKKADFRESIHTGTDIIMQKLATQLPAEYRGVYSPEKNG
jgi:1-acyl-sn-glycerol-3-phosphate acyltransferase